MKEGAWINISNRQWCWITEHADWIQVGENAQRIGLPDEVWQRIKLISNDYRGPKRESILKAVMDAGFIRMRGYGDSFSFEFTCSFLTAFEASGNFLEKNAGPATSVDSTIFAGGRGYALSTKKFGSSCCVTLIGCWSGRFRFAKKVLATAKSSSPRQKHAREFGQCPNLP